MKNRYLWGNFWENVGEWCENRWKNVGKYSESIWENVGDLGWNSVVLWVLFC